MSGKARRPKSHPWRARLLVLFLLAVSVRLFYIYTTTPESPIGSTDAWGYHRLALNLDRGKGFSLRRQAPYVPDSVRTPLYPVFLLLIRRTLGRSLRGAVVVQALLDGMTTLGAYRLATQTAQILGVVDPSTSRRTGRLAALLYALNPTQVRAANELLTETLLSFLLTCCLCIFVQCIYIQARTPSGERDVGAGRHALALGFLAGLAALCKPNVQFLPLLWFPSVLIAGRRQQSISSRPYIMVLPRFGHKSVKQPGGGYGNPPYIIKYRQCIVGRLSIAAVLQTIGDVIKYQPILHWRSAGLATIAFLAVLTPWIARNALVFGRPFVSTAFEGNVSRVSAPAARITGRGEYAVPWSTDWEAAFGDLVAQTADRYGWDKEWEVLSPRELDVANRQLYRVAREVLRENPVAWLESHALGTLRYLEPQIYRVLYARWTGRPWPPDVLDDAVLHTIRGMARGQWDVVGEIIGQERWAKISPLQRGLWWGMFVAQIVGFSLLLRGAWLLRTRPVLAIGLLGTLAYVLWLPGPIAYERFRVPVMSLIATLIALVTVKRPDTQSLAPP